MYRLILSVGALFLGLFLLWRASDKAVECALLLSYLYKVKTLFIGFALISVATGIPELFVAISSIVNNVPIISAGDIIGSNLGDVSLVLGIPLLITGKILLARREVASALAMLLVTAFVMGLVFFLGTLQWWEGLILIIVYFVCIWILWKRKTLIEAGGSAAEIQEKEYTLKVDKRTVKGKFWSSKRGVWTRFILWLLVVLVASEMLVRSALFIVSFLPVGIEVVGATIFALGTSLPELSLSIIAVRKKEYGLALGNSFGSVLVQGTLILGLLSVFSRKPIDLSVFRPIAPFMFLAYGIVGFGLVRNNKLNRKEGVLLVGTFVAFFVYYVLSSLGVL
jgi:cation:H+ antiporter